MAILVKKKKTKMLSSYSKPLSYGKDIIYGGQESRITNIEKIKKNKVKTRLNGSKSDISALEERVFTYEVFIRIDMKQVLELGVNEICFSILKGSVIKKLGNFVPLGNNSAKSLIASLYKGNKESARRQKIDRQRKVIGEGKISLSPYIKQCNTRIPKAHRTDEKVFGLIKSLTLKKVDNKIDNFENDENVAFSSQDFYKADPDVTVADFSEEYSRLIEKGVDPASVFFPSPGFTLKETGLISNIKPSYPKKIRKDRVDLIRSMFESKTPNSDNRIVAKEAKIIDRFKVIRALFRASDSELGKTTADFTFSVSIQDPSSGLTLESMDVTIPHRVNIENYYAPDFLPEIDIKRDKMGIIDTSVDITVDNIQKDKIEKVNIEARKITDDQPLSHSTFQKLADISSSDMRALINQEAYRLKRAAVLTDYEMIICRSFPATVLGNIISNITKTDTEIGKSFNYLYSGIEVETVDDGSIINYFVKSQDFSGISFYRRMAGEVNYTPINYSLQTASGEEGTTPEVAGLTLSNIASQASSGFFKDYTGLSPKREVAFQYIPRIFLKSGGDVWGKNIVTMKREKSLNLTKIEISNVKFPGIIGDNKVVSFDISAGMSTTNTDIILEVLRETGTDSIFEDTIQTTRSSLSDLVLLSVTRKNITTSEVEFVGYMKPGETFIESNFNISPAKKGNKYKYKVKTYLVNPELVEKYFNSSVNNNPNIITQTNQIKMPSFIQKIQNFASANTDIIGTDAVTTDAAVNFQSAKLQKYYSGKSLELSEIGVDQFDQDYDFENYSTGDCKFTVVDMTGFKYSISSDPTNLVTRTNEGYPVLRFKINGDTGFLDFLVVTAVRNGIEKIVGACKPDSSDQAIFIDYTSGNFSGQVEYFATSVAVDGKISEKVSIASTVLLKNKPSETRVRKYFNGGLY